MVASGLLGWCSSVPGEVLPSRGGGGGGAVKVRVSPGPRASYRVWPTLEKVSEKQGWSLTGITALCHLGLLLWTCALSREVACETEPAQPFSWNGRGLGRAPWLSWPPSPSQTVPKAHAVVLEEVSAGSWATHHLVQPRRSGDGQVQPDGLGAVQETC